MQITFADALSLATESARRVLREAFPDNAADAFESRVLENENFWLFFRNRDIKCPIEPDGTVSDDCAFAVGKHGTVLTVRDNYDDAPSLSEQVSGLSEYFATLENESRPRRS